jgi:hypothetical protein
MQIAELVWRAIARPMLRHVQIGSSTHDVRACAAESFDEQVVQLGIINAKDVFLEVRAMGATESIEGDRVMLKYHVTHRIAPGDLADSIGNVIPLPEENY